jgi:hypothetical protein
MRRFFIELGVVLILLATLTVFSARSYAQSDCGNCWISNSACYYGDQCAYPDFCCYRTDYWTCDDPSCSWTNSYCSCLSINEKGECIKPAPHPKVWTPDAATARIAGYSPKAAVLSLLHLKRS